MEREDYFFESNDEIKQDKIFILIIYDIIDNKKRVKRKRSDILVGYKSRFRTRGHYFSLR